MLYGTTFFQFISWRCLNINFTVIEIQYIFLLSREEKSVGLIIRSKLLKISVALLFIPLYRKQMYKHYALAIQNKISMCVYFLLKMRLDECSKLNRFYSYIILSIFPCPQTIIHPIVFLNKNRGSQFTVQQRS